VPDRTATVAIDLHRTPVRAFNVIGWEEGADPALRQECVIIGAHLDHDGLDEDDRIYNGADDNASGTAGVLEVADAFARAADAGVRPRRSVVFALWNGEERGLLGARAFAARQASGGLRVVANLNLDMIGRDEDIPAGAAQDLPGLAPTRASDNTNSLHVLGYSRSPELARLVREENEAIGLALKLTLDDGPEDLLRRSDQWAFLQRRIPALFFFTGLHPDYHTPQDDVDKINFTKMVKIVRLVYRVAWRAANAAQPPAYVDPRLE
jgi:Zn-dependent M28 family amino/carboxypeptidase